MDLKRLALNAIMCSSVVDFDRCEHRGLSWGQWCREIAMYSFIGDEEMVYVNVAIVAPKRFIECENGGGV